jgi:tRNA A37 threonylcarbamoyladenosine synthetase subunit TsaC/SUA5/YrdC
MTETDNGPEKNIKNFEGSIYNGEDLRVSAGLIAAGRALAVDNRGLVWAGWGDANNPKFIDEIRSIKKRDARSPFGLTLPSEFALQLVDMSRVSEHIMPLLEPKTMTERFGGLLFMRLPADETKLSGLQIPEAVTSYNTLGEPVIQNYDPTGNTPIYDLLKAAYTIKAEETHEYLLPAVTSLNPSGVDEYMYAGQAIPFAREHNTPILRDPYLEREAKAKGSFAIIDLTDDYPRLARKGNLDDAILLDLFEGFDLQIPNNLIQRASQAKPYELPDEIKKQGLKGAELAEAIRDDMWGMYKETYPQHLN